MNDVKKVRPRTVRVWNGETLVSLTCTRCGEHKDSESFLAVAKAPGGRGPKCKQCAAEWQREYAQQNLERERARGRAKYLKYRDKHAEYSRQYRQENAEVVREKKRIYAQENRARITEHQSTYRQSTEGHAKHLANNQRRRARRRDLDCGCVVGSALSSIWLAGSGACAYCDAPAEHFDHEKPLALGGKHCVSNLRLACSPCNLKKGAKTLEDFLTYMGGSAHPPSAPLLNCRTDA